MKETKEIKDSTAESLYEKTIKALQDKSILMAGGIPAYAIYVAAVLIAFFLVLQLFGNFFEYFQSLIVVVAVLLGTGLLATILAGYFDIKRKEALARLDLEKARLDILRSDTEARHNSEDLKIKTELAVQRGKNMLDFMTTWIAKDARSYENIFGKDPNALAEVFKDLDDVYEKLGIEGQGFQKLLVKIQEERKTTSS